MIYILYYYFNKMSIMTVQEAKAAQPPGRGCEFTPGGNESKTRCVH
jgi:hypothetical protein